MSRSSSFADISEPTLNVLLAELLERRGLRALGEVVLHPRLTRRDVVRAKVRKPDVLLTVNGIKVIIEGKFAGAGIDAALDQKCLERLDEGLCDICVGVQYPQMIFNTLSPTMDEVKKMLTKARLYALVVYVGAPNVKRLGWHEVDINGLAELVRSSYTSVVSEDIVGEAIESLSAAFQEAAERLAASIELDILAQRIADKMEIPRGTPEHEEPE